MPLLTELEIILGWISTNMLPLTGLTCFQLAALPRAATAGVSFSGQTFFDEHKVNIVNRKRRKPGTHSVGAEIG